MCETWHWDTLVITLYVQYGVGQRHWDGPLHIIKIIELKKLIYFNVKGKLTKIGDSTRKYSLSQLTSTVIYFYLFGLFIGRSGRLSVFTKFNITTAGS